MATNTKHAFTHQSPAIDYLMSLNAELMFLSKSFHRKQNFSEFAIVVIFCDYLNLIHIFQSCAFLEFNRPMSSSLLGQSNVSLLFLFRDVQSVQLWAKHRELSWMALICCRWLEWREGQRCRRRSMPRLPLMRSQSETGRSSVISASVSFHTYLLM